MAKRRGWKSGDWLVRDEESDFTEYGTEVGRDYYGVLKRLSQMDQAHPQEFVRAKDDPHAVYPINPPLRDYTTYDSVIGFTIANSGVSVPDGAALHLFRPGLEDAKIEYDFFVY